MFGSNTAQKNHQKNLYINTLYWGKYNWSTNTKWNILHKNKTNQKVDPWNDWKDILIKNKYSLLLLWFIYKNVDALIRVQTLKLCNIFLCLYSMLECNNAFQGRGQGHFLLSPSLPPLPTTDLIITLLFWGKCDHINICRWRNNYANISSIILILQVLVLVQSGTRSGIWTMARVPGSPEEKKMEGIKLIVAVYQI